MAVEKFFITGLGNPGLKYQYTRHNLGFLVVKKLAKVFGVRFKPCSFTKAYYAEHKEGAKQFFLLMPATYMNHSGVAFQKAMVKKGFDLETALVVCDDFHLDFGRLRIRSKGSDGGHNGLGSIIQHLGEDAFPRLRMGIGMPKGNSDVVDFVLKEFSAKEKKELDDFVDEAVRCCLIWANEGMEKAMDQFNRKKV